MKQEYASTTVGWSYIEMFQRAHLNSYFILLLFVSHSGEATYL